MIRSFYFIYSFPYWGIMKHILLEDLASFMFVRLYGDLANIVLNRKWEIPTFFLNVKNYYMLVSPILMLFLAQ